MSGSALSQDHTPWEDLRRLRACTQVTRAAPAPPGQRPHGFRVQGSGTFGNSRLGMSLHNPKLPDRVYIPKTFKALDWKLLGTHILPSKHRARSL